MGQSVGDRAAIEMTQFLMASFRDSDIIGQLSDDLFAVLLAGSPLENVEVARQRLVAKIEDRNSRTGSEYELDVHTCAVGYDPDQHTDVAELLIDAGARMDSTGAPDSANDEYDDETAILA